MADDEPLPSLDIDAVRRMASPNEVAAAIHLPLKAFASPTRIRQSMFRGSRPYWPVDVTDLVYTALKKEDIASKTVEIIDEVGSEGNGRIEVWGLTGWYLTLLMKALHVYQ